MKNKNLSKLSSAALLGVWLLAIGYWLCAPSAQAQDSVDYFGTPRLLVVQPPTLLAAASTLSNTNDTHGYVGVANLILIGLTNSETGTITATVMGSSDTLNWAALTYAQAVSTSVTYTNILLGAGTNKAWADTYLLPGTITTPTATSAGFATPYLLPVSMTNVAVVTLTTAGIASIGYNISDAPRYLRVTWTAAAGAITNGTVAAVLVGRRSSAVK